MTAGVEKKFISYSLFRFLKGSSRTVAGKMMVAGGIILLAFIIFAVFSPFIAPYDPIKSVGKAFLPPDRHFWMGTDNLGRDMLSRVIYGARIALAIAIISVGIAFAIGVPLGLISGYIGGIFDRVITMIMDSIYSFPGLILAIAIAAMLGPGIINIAVSIAVVYAPTYFRVVRNQVMSVKSHLFVEAARALGANNKKILTKYILPNVMPSIAVIFSMNIADAIMTEAGLSFLGLGITPPTPDWGYDLNNGQRFLLQNYWWMVFFPGLAIVLVVLGFSMFGEGLNEYMNTSSGDRG